MVKKPKPPKATSGDVASKLPRDLTGPLIQRRRGRTAAEIAALKELPVEEMVAALQAEAESVPGRARQRLVEILGGAMFDPIVSASEQYQWLAFCMKEWATETAPDDTPKTMVEALETFVRKTLASGGRPAGSTKPDDNSTAPNVSDRTLRRRKAARPKT